MDLYSGEVIQRAAETAISAWTPNSTAAASVRTFAHGTDRREGILADITLARLHVQTGEPDAPRLAASAISAVAPLRSSIARAALVRRARQLSTSPA